jgi:hypothetical protein
LFLHLQKGRGKILISLLDDCGGAIFSDSLEEIKNLFLIRGGLIFAHQLSGQKGVWIR